MSEQPTHSAEPWALATREVGQPDEDGRGPVRNTDWQNRIADANGVVMTRDEALYPIALERADMARAVACVNFCRGPANENLPPGGLARVTVALRECFLLLQRYAASDPEVDEACDRAQAALLEVGVKEGC